MNFKFSVINKNQILTWSVIVMLVIAGFLNYQNDPKKVYDVEVTGAIDENLGDAVFVDSDNLVTNIDELIDEIDDKNVKFTSAEYFSDSRITRNNNYDKQIETYENILIATSSDDKQKQLAQVEIKRINDEKNAVSIAENLIKLKGIEEAIILVNGESVNVVVLENDLDEAKIAQIQNIIQNELNVSVENVHINSIGE